MDPVFDLTLRAALALLFLSAAWHKLRAPEHFHASLADYHLLPPRALPAAARALPLAELATSVALVAPPLRAVAPIAALLLLALYSVAIAWNLGRGRREIDCGCSGPGLRQPLGPGLLARNAVLASAALLCMSSVGARPLVWVDFASVFGATLVLAAVYECANRLLASAPVLARLRAS
jgi:uncharacterized membrane protein YphA (DoxX/SURF4 family)